MPVSPFSRSSNPLAATLRVLALAIVMGSVSGAAPVLNEFLASNSGGLADEDGDSSDWIEIHNPDPIALDLGGYKLEDSSNTWEFPAGSMVPANGYRIVFASSKDRRNPAANLHTNFGLSAEGEYLALKAANNSIVSGFTPAYPVQRQNVSCGKSGTTVVFFAPPTPAAANGTASSGLVGDVFFSSERGFYTTGFQLTLGTPTPGAPIRYTLDASTPTEATGTLYTGPITIDATKMVRAAAFRSGYLPSPVATHSYLFLDDVLANQVYAGAPTGWPASPVNGQIFRYGWNTTIKTQYSDQQLLDGLRQIPSLSLVTDQGNLTAPGPGIYVNADQKGDNWERPVSVEYLSPDGDAGFHINAGLRIRGGFSRNDGYVKHALRLHFRSTYGESKLKFPLHDSGTDEFETLDLRTEQNYHWANDNGTQNTAVREVFCRDLAGAAGLPTTRSRYVHLYLNGEYWGLYQTEERAQEDYGASYFGGKGENYDVIQTSNHPNFTYELSSGTINAWQAMWSKARTHASFPTAANYFALMGCNPDGQRNPALPVYVDLENLITYMLVNYYVGDGDAPLSGFLQMNRANNWRGMRNRLGSEGFRYFVHDSEHTLQAPSWIDNRVTTNAPNGSNRSNFTYSNPEWIHEDLSANPEYRIHFADVAQKHLFNGGSMTYAAALALFDARVAQISQSIVPDAARWGRSEFNHTRSQWQTRLNAIRDGFFPGRSAALISQLRIRGFLPLVDAPVFSHRGGSVGGNYTLTLAKGDQTGSIIYTTDGSDPRAVGGGVAGLVYDGAGIPVSGLMKVRARFRSSTGVWSALDEASFIAYPPAIAGDIVISKIHYHPSNPTSAELSAGFDSDSDFEYIELLNISGHGIDISGLSFTDGIEFNFANSAIGGLAPGGRIVVAGKAAALKFRHGAGIPIAGSYSGDLANGGAFLRLAGGGNAPFREFSYDDAAPWPTTADGGGQALVMINPFANPDHGEDVNWRASHTPGGRPGEADGLLPEGWRPLYFSAGDLGDPAKEATLWGDDADPDRDGMVNLIEMATGSSPISGQSQHVPVASWWVDPQGSGSYLTLTCRIREELSGVDLAVRASSDLVTWPVVLDAVSTPVSQGDGTTLVTFRDPVPVGNAPGQRRFLRLVVTAP